jgi:hypothetical protein
MFHLRSPKLYEFLIARWLFVIGISRRLWGCCGNAGTSYPAGAEKRSNLVFIDVVSLAVFFFIASLNWPGANARDVDSLCCLGNQLAIAKITKRANDNQQS